MCYFVKCVWKNIFMDPNRQSLVDDVQGGFRVGRGCIDQIFTLKQIDEKAQEKKCSVCSFHGPGENMIGSQGKHYGKY